MMKKVLYGVALTLFASVSVGSLQSCKDDVNDLKTQTSYNLSALQADIQSKLDELERKINGKADAQGNATLEDLKAYATLKYVNELIYGVENPNQEDINKIKDAGGLLAMIQGALDAIDNLPSGGGGCSCDLQPLRDDVDKMLKLLYPTDNLPADYGDSANMIAYLLGRVGANKASVDAINSNLDKLADYLGLTKDENGNVSYDKDLKDQLKDINDDIKGVNDQLKEMTEGMTADSQDLKDLLAEVMKIENEFLQVINDRINSLITSIKVERAVSPVFGDLSIPVGIKSNVLFNWYGYSDRGEAVPFPTDMEGLVGKGVKLPAGVQAVSIPDKYFDDEVELGDVYVTLNPVGHVYNGTELSFTTSAGKTLDFKVSIEPSDYELMHGYSRAEITDNGFYKGKVTVPSDQLESIKLSIDDQLMSAMKDAVKDQSKHNAAALIKAIYNEMSGIMPAYALRYDWTSKYYNGNASLKDETVGEGEDATTVQVPNWNSEYSDKAYAVLSSYDLAVAAARPLGFNFLQGEGASSNKVPTISNIDNFIAELIKENLDKITVTGQKITIDGNPISLGTVEFWSRKVEIEVNGHMVETDQLYAIVKGLTVGTTVLDDFEVICSAADTAAADVTFAIKEKINDVINPNDSETIRAEIDVKVDLILLEMQNQINDVVSKLNGQIKDAFSGMGDSVDTYINKVNRAIDLYNKVANKINTILKDPNHYLQAAVFYNSGSNIGILSGDPNSPTTFTGKGNVITLYLSTYTGEIIAPAYKKYIAVTTEGAGSLNTGDLNTVLDGSRIKVEVDVDNFVSNKVYELTYQAVDYRGFYSTRKCYVKVVK